MSGKLARIRRILKKYSTKKALFGYIGQHLFKRTDYRYKIVLDAYELAEKEFASVKRESGEPYMTHNHGVTVIGVVYMGIRNYQEIAALPLHDLQEEFWMKWPTYKIAERFGNGIARIVDECTIIPHFYHFDSEEERQAFYFNRIRRSHAVSARLRNSVRRTRPGSKRVKLCDRLHNLLTMKSIKDPKRRMAKIRETQTHLMPSARKYRILYSELSAAMKEAAAL